MAPSFPGILLHPDGTATEVTLDNDQAIAPLLKTHNAGTNGYLTLLPCGNAALQETLSVYADDEGMLVGLPHSGAWLPFLRLLGYQVSALYGTVLLAGGVDAESGSHAEQPLPAGLPELVARYADLVEKENVADSFELVQHYARHGELPDRG